MPTSFSFQVLGANSATPMPDRYPSCFILEYDGDLIVVDCGEGAQMKMSEYKVRRSKVSHVFISHLHGDHVFGLPGLLNSFSLNDRRQDLHLYGPVGLKRYIEGVLTATYARASYEVFIHEIDSAGAIDIPTLAHLQVSAMPLIHRIPTWGYRFDEIRAEINVKVDAIRTFELTIEEIIALKSGGSVFRNGQVVPHDRLIVPPKAPRSFAYCSDTIYDPDIVPLISGVDLLYHEATFMHDLVEKAHERMHATAREAAQIAAHAKAGRLIIGHYSSRYRDLRPLLEEAQAVFASSSLAIQGEIFDVRPQEV